MVALGETILDQPTARPLPHRDCGTGISAGQVNYLYYNSSWQLIEVRSGGTANSNVTSQTVWSAAYINAAVLQDTFSNGVIQPISRLYFLQDANWNTTAVVGYDATTQTWNVVQRYVYSPYGNIIMLNANFTTAPAGTLPMASNLYQGMSQDPVTGLYYERARWYSPSLGTWISQDPAGYINGADTYQFVKSNPANAVDPWGLDAILLISPGAAGGFGHAAVLVGSNATGWFYFSKNAWGNGSPTGNVDRWYPNLQSFLNSPSYNGPIHGKRYPERMRIPTAPCQNNAMAMKGIRLANSPYSVATNNCATQAIEILNSGGIETGESGPLFGWGPDIPNLLLANLVDEMVQGTLVVRSLVAPP